MAKFNPSLLDNILFRLETMTNSRQEIIAWLKEFIDDIKTQEVAVNATKTGTAALGVVSFIGLFTPFAPLAVGGMIAAGVGGAATAIGDFAANKVKQGNLQEKIECIGTEDAEFDQLMKELDQGAEILSKELKITKEDAMLFYLVGIPKVVAQFGIQAVRGGVEMVKVLPHLKAACDAMRLGASFANAFKLSGTVFQGARLSVMGAGQAARVGATFGVTLATKVLGGFGAVIGIADVIYSWSTQNPNRESAEKLLPQLEEGLKRLMEMKKQFLQLKPTK